MQIDRSRPLPAQIVEDVRGRITDSRLAPGDPLPSTRVLARQLGISRGSVVSAYEQLVGEGLLITSPGGTRVDPSLRVPGGPAAAPAGRLCGAALNGMRDVCGSGVGDRAPGRPRQKGFGAHFSSSVFSVGRPSSGAALSSRARPTPFAAPSSRARPRPGADAGLAFGVRSGLAAEGVAIAADTAAAAIAASR